MEQVEHVIAHAVLPAGAQVRLQPIEGRETIAFLDHDLSVEQRRADAQLLERGRDRSEALGPVEALAREQLHFAAVEARLDPIAVVLDLVHPFGSARRALARRGEARLDEGRQQLLPRAAHFADVGQGRLAGALLLGPRRMVDAHRSLCGNLLRRQPAQPGCRLLLGDLRIAWLAGKFVLRLEQEPRLGLLARLGPDSYQMPLSLEPAAVEREGEVAFAEPVLRVELGRPRPTIPHDHRAAAVFAFRDVAFEREVVERMILGAHGEPLLPGRERRPARHRPALERAVKLEAEVPVQPARRVLLHHEGEAGGGALGLRRSFAWHNRRRLGRAAEIALGRIGIERRLACARARRLASLQDAPRAVSVSLISQNFNARFARAAHGESGSSLR
jgi:hypothetical protein